MKSKVVPALELIPILTSPSSPTASSVRDAFHSAVLVRAVNIVRTDDIRQPLYVSAPGARTYYPPPPKYRSLGSADSQKSGGTGIVGPVVRHF